MGKLLVRWIRELDLQEYCRDLRKDDPAAAHKARSNNNLAEMRSA